jgi:hypothetical protein
MLIPSYVAHPFPVPKLSSGVKRLVRAVVMSCMAVNKLSFALVHGYYSRPLEIYLQIVVRT